MKTETVINEDGAEVEVVPVDVAQLLYDALKSSAKYSPMGTPEFRKAHAALAAADGEEL